jgi:hypothetical protein
MFCKEAVLPSKALWMDKKVVIACPPSAPTTNYQPPTHQPTNLPTHQPANLPTHQPDNQHLFRNTL